MTELDQKAIDAATGAFALQREGPSLAIEAGVRRAITAYLDKRRARGWVEVRVDDDVVANSIVAAAVEAERARCAVIVASYVGENDPAAWRWAAEAIEQAAPAPIFNVVEQARDEEREACARDIDQYRQEIHDQEDWADQALHEENVLVSAADKIRSRSQRERA